MTEDPVISAMKSGAGLPVLSVLDTCLSARTRGEADQALGSRTLDTVTSEVQTWLQEAHARLQDRLSLCDAGPFRATMETHLTNAIESRQKALDDVRVKAEDGHEESAWALLEAEFLRLHTLRSELHHLGHAARHLAEVARLVGDIPQDEAGQAALDELAAREAMAASHPTPEAWAKAAEELEQHCLDHVRFTPPEPTPPERPAEEAGTNGQATPRSPEAEEISWDGQASSNGQASANGQADANGQTTHDTQAHTAPAQPEAEAKPATPKKAWQRPSSDGSSPLARFMAGRKEQSQAPSRDPAAGQPVLEAWNGRVRDLIDRGQLPSEFRHAPLWAPIARGDVVPAAGTTDELLEVALEVEIDLVEIELPRILAMATGADPEKLHTRLAERAKEISLQDPKRSAREALLDYILGKLPIRYRETAEGLALLESIGHALAKDEPWEARDHDFGQIVRNLVERELDRTPAVDLTDLSTSLIGHRDHALEIVADAAETIAEEDPDVRIYPDGIMVRALTQREDPDKLYQLRGALESRMGTERASTLIKALITAGGEQDE